MSQRPSWVVGLLDEVLGVGEFGDVGLHHDAFAAGGVDLVAGLVGLLDVVAIVDDAVCAFLRETLRDGLTYAGAGSGDDGDLA